MTTIRFAVLAVAAAALLAGTAGAGVQDDRYAVNNLVADSAGSAAAADGSLVNGWGLVAGPTTPWWTSNNGSNTSTLYNGAGAKQALTVTVAGAPTGSVFNGVASDFPVSAGGKTGQARFIFSTEGGTILGWSPTVNGTVAVVGADSSSRGAVYKGLATAADRLYATDFHNGRVDVFDKAFQPVTLASGAFTDPKLPKGFAPFGIQSIAGNIFVTYAKQDAQKHDDVAGGGLGYVDEYSTDGQFIARVETGGRKNSPPNAPWGLAMAPATGFGVFSGDLLIGNFGNGRIAAYQDRGGGKWVYKGELRHGDGTLVAIDGLWGLQFGNGAAAGPATTLYFTAGPGGEKHGLFGSITAA
ncbi:MAG TPA: TIGR03118 family protein [Gaiellaceae bacterium]|nr:TIGR03118 family protein [Gaiellaceae bacterium]